MLLKNIFKRSVYLVAAASAFVLVFLGLHDAQKARTEYSSGDTGFFVNTAHADVITGTSDSGVDVEVHPGDDDGDGS